MVVGISLNKWKAGMKCRGNLIELMKHNLTEFCLNLIRLLIFGENVVGVATLLVMMSSVLSETKDRVWIVAVLSSSLQRFPTQF